MDKNSNHLDYAGLMHQRRLRRFAYRPWALRQQWLVSRIKRYFAATVFLALALFVYQKTAPCPLGGELFLHPLRYFLFALSVALGFSAIPTVFSGVRGFIGAVSLILFLSFSYGIVALCSVKQNLLWLFLLILLWAIVAVLLVLYSIDQQVDTVYPYEKDRFLIGACMDLTDFMPLDLLPECLIAKLRLPDDADEDSIDGILQKLIWHSNRSHCVFAGYVFSYADHQLLAVFYGSSIFALETRIGKLFHSDAVISKQQDPKWEVYYEELFPETDFFFHLIHKHLLESVEEQEIDLDKERTLHYLIALPDQNAKAELVQGLSKLDFHVDINSHVLTQSPALPKGHIPFTLDVQSRLGLERLDLIAHKLNELVQLQGGKLVDLLLYDFFDE